MEYNTLIAFAFSTLTEAEAAQRSIDAAEGFGVSEDQETKHYAAIEPLPDGSFMIIADEVTKKYLGEPTTIQIPINNN